MGVLKKGNIIVSVNSFSFAWGLNRVKRTIDKVKGEGFTGYSQRPNFFLLVRR